MNFKVQTFDARNINKIKDNWADIRKALLKTTAILREFGFNKTRLSSNYAATPIAYYLFKDGILNKDTKSELRILVIHSLLKQVYSGQADSALSGLREGLRSRAQSEETDYQLRNRIFSFSEYQHTKLSGGKKLTIDAEDIDFFLDYKKGAFTFLVLSVLYPDLKLDQISFHQDHMHPHSRFKHSQLIELGLDSDTIYQWQEMRDQLPNLQLLEGQENTEKQATKLSKWVNDNETDEVYYRQRNYIPPAQSLELKEFNAFFASRRELLSNRLHQIFNVASLPVEEKAIA